MGLHIVCWRDRLDAMSPRRKYWVQPMTSAGDAVLDARMITARTEDGAVKRLVRWMLWEGYEVEGLCVYLEEVEDG